MVEGAEDGVVAAGGEEDMVMVDTAPLGQHLCVSWRRSWQL